MAENSRLNESLKLAVTEENFRLNESLTLAVTKAVCKLSGDLHRELILWEAKMDDKVKTQLMNHRSEFEKKWESKIAQLEPGSLEGVISSAEFCIQKKVEETVDKNWKDRMEKEDKIMINKVETLHSRLPLGVEAVILVHVLLALRVNGCLHLSN